MITLFYARFAYINPGVPLFLQALQDNPPEGMRVVNVSERTPDEIGHLAAESSTIAIDQSIENAATWADPAQFSVYRIRGGLPMSFFAEISERLWNSDAAKLFVSNFDLHDLRLPALLEKMKGKVQAISWMFEKRPRSLDAVPPQYRDRWLTSQHDPLGTWNLVREIVPVRIELPFSIAPAEFSPRSRRFLWDVCVPGTSYSTRVLATRSLKKAGLSRAPARFVGRVTAALALALEQLAPVEAGSLVTIHLYHIGLRAVVRASEIVFVCGSGLAFATRKFFEMPALEIPVIAYPCVGFEDYGFSDGINVVATIPEDAGKNAKWLRDNPSQAERIASEGQRLIGQVHSVEVRVKQFVECLRRLDRGTLHRAEFHGGQFEIE